MAEDMKAHHKAIDEKIEENKRLLFEGRGIPEWCAMAAGSRAADEGNARSRQEEGAARQRKKCKSPAAAGQQSQ